jgi:hypothetical protein
MNPMRAPSPPVSPTDPGVGNSGLERPVPLAAYLAESQPIPPLGVDPSGRALPISVDERKARFEDLRRRLAEIDAEDETSEEVYDQFLRNLDEERRRIGRPPAFAKPECGFL